MAFMLSYTPPLRDVGFALDVIGLDELIARPAFSHVDRETIDALIAEFGRLMADSWGDLNESGDREGVAVDSATGTVRVPAGFREAYQQYVAGGWGAVGAPLEHGGGGFPHTVALVLGEMMGSANMALGLCPMLTQAAIEALGHAGTAEQQTRYLDKLITGEWSGTMNLTEPDAGSDVGALRTRAVPQPDGTWRITGQKIYITWGEHEMADNIVHLVLARRDGAPPGTKGISCFIVPKYLVNADGSLGARNDVRVVSTEHKMGIHASPTCVMAYGDGGEGAVGELIGEIDGGMRTMFIMMNNARLAVGQEGAAVGERAYQLAFDHAMTRVQGRTITGAMTIIGHPDVARMLMLMRCQLDAARLLVFLNARAIDESRHLDGDAKRIAQERADLYTPLTKAWVTDLGVELASLGVQVFGGMGFCEDTGAAQLYRDIRIAPIYEGTNGIQAMDLIGRKLAMRDGAVVAELLADIRATCDVLGAAQRFSLRDYAASLRESVTTVEQATKWMSDTARSNIADAGAGSVAYLQALATVVGGWLLGRQALLAVERLAGADTADESDREYLEAKIASTVAFGALVLPTVASCAAQATTGAAAVMSVPHHALASR
jgi:3-(methylthio)propanoyl-CoA dehydrogenase